MLLLLHRVDLGLPVLREAQVAVPKGGEGGKRERTEVHRDK